MTDSTLFTLRHSKLSGVPFSVLFITFQMRGTCLVEIFCELDLEVYDKAVGESISKLAFEAMEKIIQVDWCNYNNLLM